MKSYSQALKILKKGKILINDEYIECSKSLNRISAENIYSKVDNPSANNSSLDGYAINSNDTKNLSKKKTKLFFISGTIEAGKKIISKNNKKFETYEIMTGGILPNGFNAIIPKEKIIFPKNENYSKYILINEKIKKFYNVRFKGSDYKKNDLIVKKGTILKPNHILAFKTLGVNKIKVKKIPNILFFSTGNEITEKLNIPNWKVRNSNINYIQSINNNFSFKLIDGGILRDKDEYIFEKHLKKMINSNIDIIITSGAVSEGKFDYIPKIVKKFKSSHYFKNVSIRPGKPILFSKIKGKEKAVFGLPGNPMSSAACLRFFVYPFLENILSLSKEEPVKAILKNNFEKKRNFTRFIKSKLNTTKNGKLEVKLLSGQESFKINSFVASNVWAVLPYGKSKFKKGQIIDCFFPNQPNKILG
tara:strand:- start:1136 stop:2389 length:1254 start_codon:yes stop_codon:yes gene_type:complete